VNQIVKNIGLVLFLLLLTMWTQLAWLLGLLSPEPIKHSLLVTGGLLTGGVLFCWLIRYTGLFVSNKRVSAPGWLRSITQQLAQRLTIAEPEVHILRTDGLNAFAIDNLTRRGHIMLHQQIISSLTHDEIEAIVAHEMCHIEKGHAGVLTFMQGVMLPISLPLSLLICIVFCLVTGFDQFKPKLLQVNSFLSFALFPFTSVVLLLVSRGWEYEADACASSLVGKNQYLQVLRCLHGSFFQHPNFLATIKKHGKTKTRDGGITHPSLTQRINALQESSS
jgi:heat shock protein HtpX